MSGRRLHPAAAAGLATVAALAACGGAEPEPSRSSAPAVPTTTDAPPFSATPDASATPSPAAPAATTTLPDLVGQGLQYAQDTAQAAGFRDLTSHDALGRGRAQVLDRNWKVCFQAPGPGPASPETTVDLGAVKVEERCPRTDAGARAPAKAGALMPDLRGKSVTIAVETLGTGASLRFRDGTGRDRTVVLPSNWKVCAQDPAPGKPFGGVPVTLTVVRFEERC